MTDASKFIVRFENSSIAISFFVFIVFCLYFVPLTKPFPYSDDWIYVGYEYGGLVDFFAWAFALHNDHRIPIQKIIHFLLLKISGGDFRSIIIFNGLACLLTAFCWIWISRIVNSRTIGAEAVIPLLVLSFGFNSMFWGFNFQFLSSFLFLSFAIMFFMKAYNDINNENYGFFILSLCALCGSNGLLGSLVVGSGFIFWSLICRPREVIKLTNFLGFFVWFATVILLLLNWKSSSASNSEIASAGIYLRFFFGMLKSWMGVYGIEGSPVNIFVSVSVIVGAIFIPVKYYIQQSSDDASLRMRYFITMLLLLVFQTFLLVIVVTGARASAQPWWPGLELHYGYLVIALPLCFAVSLGFVRQVIVRRSLYIIFTFFVSAAFIHNFVWRSRVAENEFKVNSATVADLMSSKAGLSVAKDHIKSLYWVEGEQAEIAVGSGIESLRKFRLWSANK